MPDDGDTLSALLGDDPAVVDRLMASLHDDLSRLARSKLRSERPGHTLDTVALVNEAYLKMADHTRVEWKSRSHFLAMAAVSMRRILVDYAKARNAERRGGGQGAAETLEEGILAAAGPGLDLIDLLELENSLIRLEAFNPRGAKVVEFRFFAGLTYEEIADVMGVSVPTVRRSWAVARAWLANELR
ncbi:MAG TPA: ECF-type sigma factor [Longimicrobiales bacterium]|nr:ECF-type sigma factor [Longimicrobiales bacterium]